MTLPNLNETVLGVFLHDMGKFAQRAGLSSELPPEVAAAEGHILPKRNGRPTHWHALWTEAFFHWMEKRGLSFPGGVSREQVRLVAVYHHNPEGAAKDISAIGRLAAEADRLSAGMDRKLRDEEQEQSAAPKTYLSTPLLNPFMDIRLDGESVNLTPTIVPLGELVPGEQIMPQPKVDAGASGYAERYRQLYDRFLEEFASITSFESFQVFSEALLSLFERFTSSIPSSTIDQPDISLYDHSRSAAAIAAALYRWHEAEGSLEDALRITDRSLRKFRFLIGDLSGIQDTLFRLAHQQVKGVNRILRARSFAMLLVTEAAAIECRRVLDLPAFSVLQSAGGRFLMLVADVPGVQDALAGLRASIDPWMLQRWRGELSLNIALTEAFSGEDLMRQRYPALQEKIRLAAEAAKLRAFHGHLKAVHSGDDYSNGPCSACGVRPGECRDTGEDGEIWRCRVCDDEHRLGAALPRIRALAWMRRPPGPAGGRLRFWDELTCAWYEDQPLITSDLESAARIYQAEETLAAPSLALRFVANYVPRMESDETGKPAYRLLSKEALDVRPGELKLFEHIAADAIESGAGEGELRGEMLLAVLKADVDRLGQIFASGLQSPSLGRFAGLSRFLDFFFSAYLPELLRRDSRFKSTYTVYAGGDDLLLIGPWRQTAELAAVLREKFQQWVGGNPQVTISAALELIKPDQPLNRAVRNAEARLEAAKDQGRNRISAIDPLPQTWEDYRRQLISAETIHAYLSKSALSQSFVYRMLALDRARLAVESSPRNGGPERVSLEDAGWRALWGYQLARNVLSARGLADSVKRELAAFLNSLLGLDPDLRPGKKPAPSARTAISIALYRNRKPSKRS